MTWARGSTRQWRTIRAKVLRRDPDCQLGYDGCTRISTSADHILNVEAGGTDHPSNLQGVCRSCHGVKTQAEAAAGRRTRRTLTEVHPGLRIPPGA